MPGHACFSNVIPDDTGGEGGGPRTSGLRHELVRVQRAKLDELYRNRKISDEIRRSIALTLDLQDGPRGGLPPA
jgi:hypothetical protein